MLNIFAELEYQQATAVPLLTDKPKGHSGAPTYNSVDTNGDREMVKMQQRYKELNISKGKGKAIPLQAWTDPEVSRRFRLPDFKTIST